MSSNVLLYDFVRRTRRSVVQLKSSTGESSEISLSPFIYFADGDRLRIEYSINGGIDRIDKLLQVPGRNKAQQDECKIFPYFVHREDLVLTNGAKIPVVFKEVTTDQEFSQLRYLEQFHYLQAKPAWGRQMYLIVRPEVEEVLGTPLPGVFGCVVLTSPSILSGPRNNLLEWNDRAVLSENVDRVVRIARVIIHPEFRGLRLGAKLVHHSIAYCRDRWNVKGKKAWFVETVAEMSRYHPFFEKGGMRLIGETKSQDKAFFFHNESKSLGIDQGAGHVMASLKRFKQKVHTQKPYLMVSLLPEDDPLSQKVLNAAPDSLRSGDINLVETRLTEPITLRGVKAVYPGRSLWDEPEELNQKWLLTARKTYSDLQAYVDKLDGLVQRLGQDPLWQEGRAEIITLGAQVATLQEMVDTSRGGLGTLNDEVSRLFREFGLGLHEVSYQRSFLQNALADLRTTLEQEIGPINALEEERKAKEGEDSSEQGQGDTGSRLPPELSKQRAELNALRTKVQKAEEALEMGTASPQQRWVTDAFGVRQGQGLTTMTDFNLEIWPGSVVLVVGPSGSGKSTLLNLLSGSLSPASGEITPEGLFHQVSVLDLNFDPSKPLIDLVGRDPEEAVFLLNHVDLAESHLYVKRRDQLSHGQRYRAAFAQMLADRHPVWLADEFCAFLDPVTTLTLCKGIRKLVRRQGITFMAAAAKEDYIRDALEPDFIIRINAGGHLTPAPKDLYWASQPNPEALATALLGSAQKVESDVARWARVIDLIESDPFSLSGVRWTSAAERLRQAACDGYEAFAQKLAEHLWSKDWMFHRVWNRVRTRQPLGEITAKLGREAGRPSQVRYRVTLATSLVCHWPSGEDSSSTR